MKWTSDAEALLTKVPFFVRKRVRKKVEEEASRQGLTTVTKPLVVALQRKFMASMEEEVKGYSVETCFGPSGCPNRAVKWNETASRLETILAGKDLKKHLRVKVGEALKFHHEFRVAVADCPNCCSRPQICDVGLVGASKPRVTDEPCSRCGACVEACPDDAVTLSDAMDVPEIDFGKCLSCGKCIQACPTGTIAEAESGYRILVGGKLGRHPHLADELPGIHVLNEACEIVNRCVDYYKEHNERGERFGEVLRKEGLDSLKKAVGL